MPVPKTLKEQLDEALATGGGLAAIDHAIRRGVRARGHDVVEPEHRQLIHDHVNEKFAIGGNGRAYAIYQGRTIDAAEGVRQVINVVVAQLESAEQPPAGQELTPIEQVQAKGKARGIYAF